MSVVLCLPAHLRVSTAASRGRPPTGTRQYSKSTGIPTTPSDCDVNYVGEGSGGEAAMDPEGTEGGEALDDDDDNDEPAETAVCAFVANNLSAGSNRGSWKPLQKGWKRNEKKEPRRVGDPPLSFGEFIRAHPQDPHPRTNRGDPAGTHRDPPAEARQDPLEDVHQVDPSEVDPLAGEDPLDRVGPAEALLEDPLGTPTAHGRMVARRPLGGGSSGSAGGSSPSSAR